MSRSCFIVACIAALAPPALGCNAIFGVDGYGADGDAGVATGTGGSTAQTGGFGHLTIVSYDASGEQQAWDRSLQLLMNDVLPRCQGAGVNEEPKMGISA